MSITDNIVIQADNINFCPGPCIDTTLEPLPKKFGKENVYVFKPHSGGRYQSISYPMSGGGELILKNVRMCRSCYRRHMEFDEEDLIQYLNKDCDNIIKKLKNSGILTS